MCPAANDPIYAADRLTHNSSAAFLPPFHLLEYLKLADCSRMAALDGGILGPYDQACSIADHTHEHADR
jgi:hypothetical protein